jgi:lipoyl(octanoyl) transferase
MEIDAEMLEAAVAGLCTLRFYEWSVPTVSLGYFQDPGDVPPHLSDLPAVRRLSGGGAILHEKELTYSCALPASHPCVRDPGSIYDRVHRAIISVLVESGIDCCMRQDLANRIPKPSPADSSRATDVPSQPAVQAAEDSALGPQPSALPSPTFLCFARGDARDIVINDSKIVGSAQRRRRGAVLQHGSILLRASAHAPEFPGIRELAGLELSPEDLLANLIPAIAGALSLDLQPVGEVGTSGNPGDGTDLRFFQPPAYPRHP